MPTTGAALKKDILTLNKAVAQQNNRGSVASVQKAGRASERAKKRAAKGGASEEANGRASRVILRAVKKAKVAACSTKRGGKY